MSFRLPKQQAEGHRPPEAGKGQPPVIPEQAHRNHGGGYVGAVQVAQHMAPDMLHAADIAHQGSVRSARSRLPKSRSGSFRSRSARRSRVVLTSPYTRP